MAVVILMVKGHHLLEECSRTTGHFKLVGAIIITISEGIYLLYGQKHVHDPDDRLDPIHASAFKVALSI